MSENDLFIICNGTYSCYDSIIHADNISSISIHCVQPSSCLSARMNIVNVLWENHITCYDRWSCNSLQIISNNNFTQLSLYQYSQDVHFHNIIGYDAIIQNIKCYNTEERRFTVYDASVLQTDQQLIYMARDSFQNTKMLPCEGVIVHCGDFECFMRYNFNISMEQRMDLLDSQSQCYWFDFIEFAGVECQGQCDDFSFTEHQIRLNIKIDFNSRNYSNLLCKSRFGNINMT
eukprot:430479_1